MSDEVMITVEEAAANHSPVASDAYYVTEQATSVPVALLGTDEDNDPLNYSIIQDPENGSLSGTGSTRVYLPNPGFVGIDSFLFMIDDGELASGAATVEITVTPAD